MLLKEIHLRRLGLISYQISTYIIPHARLDRNKHSIAPLSPELTLTRAAELYLDRRTQYLKPRSIEAYRYHFRTLSTFFGPDKTLSSFHEGSFRDYQRWRLEGNEQIGKAGPSCINHELGALAQLLMLADLWTPIEKYYERLPEPDWSPPKVLTEEEEERFFRFAARKPEWSTAYHAAMITNNTTRAGCELRVLRLEHLRLDRNPAVVHVPKPVKNGYRVRSVPLNDTLSRRCVCSLDSPRHEDHATQLIISSFIG